MMKTLRPTLNWSCDDRSLRFSWVELVEHDTAECD